MKGLAMTTKTLLATATAGLALALSPAAALASDGLTVQDRCDPATFNPAGIDCQPITGQGGTVTLDALFGSLVAGAPNDGWRFRPGKISLREGQPLDIAMTRGGEGHTVTEVAAFGPGCVPEINAILFPGQAPAAECANPATFTPGIFGGDLIVPGLDFSKTGLAKGTHRFQCMIHPWMKTTVAVR
jgi:plastocyanin